MSILRCTGVASTRIVYEAPPLNVNTVRAILYVAIVGAVCLGAFSSDSATAQERAAAPLDQPGTARVNIKLIQVGPGREIKTLRVAASMARDGDTVEVDAGSYRGDSAVWTQSDLIVRGIGTRPTLVAESNADAAEGKGIFVVRGDNITIENIGFVGARVADRNGAGIRLERGRLKVVKCSFESNENGILTSNDGGAELTVIDSIFLNNGAGDGYSHHLYAGSIAKVDVRGSYFGPARTGHLFKSRAKTTSVLYSRLTGETGTSSYELDVSNGGTFTAIGNLIQQGSQTENHTMISYGAEGYRWPNNHAHIAFNTIINDRAQGGVFIAVRPGAADAIIANNIMVGRGDLDLKAPAQVQHNVHARTSDFANPSQFDYRLRLGSKLVGRAGFAGSFADIDRPTREYRHVAESENLTGLTQLTPLSPGGFQRVAQ